MSSGIKWNRREERIKGRLARVRPSVEELYLRGEERDGWWERVVAIVGSRRMSAYGKRVVERLVPELVEEGVTIVSGMMYGVDQEVHRVCLGCGGRTVAVLGWGIDYEVSEQDRVLYKEIERKGMIISEYQGKIKPQKFTFVRRNRIVAGLADGVVVVEGGLGSGSLVTAEWAGKMGVRLMAVPGMVISSLSAGTNMLIKEGKAKMVRDGRDVLECLGWSGGRIRDESGVFESEAESLLGAESLAADELARKLKKPVREVLVELGRLQLSGKVEERGGKWWKKGND